MHALKHLNSFGLDVNASAYTSIQSTAQFKRTIKDSSLPCFILGGGSNILFSKDLHAHVLHNQIKGIKIIDETRDFVFVKAAAGETWHDLVLWTIEKNLGGLENLSLIPGSVGAAPIQNIGAYGVELKDVFHELKAIQKSNLKSYRFDKKACQFGYRDSIFKNSEKNRFFISSITLKLRKKAILNLTYGAIQSILEDSKIKNPSIKDVSDAVIKIRQSKLPDPSKLGNAGSFFKNPIVDKEIFNTIKKKYPKVPSYPISDHSVKIPAGWLIEQCGWKGRRIGDAGCYEKQALVIVNHGAATGEEIKSLALNIKKSVYKQFSILIQNEVNII